MPSSFKKVLLNKEDPLPIRQVHGKHCEFKPRFRELDSRGMLQSLEDRLVSLKEDLTSTYETQLEQAREIGYKEGFAQGRAEAQGLVDKAEEEIKRIHGQKQIILKEQLKGIVSLIITICEEILLEQILEPANVTRLVEGAIAQLQPPLDALVYCHPSKVQNLVSSTSHFTTLARGNIEIVSNPLLPEHVIKVESGNSVLEIDLLNELKEIAEEMGAELGL